ncbi:hypothetical protein CKO_02847 [Citrobacter koseri ATCC BAA-895]|uniref:Uncharacterized protein n=1 Tax=Citrobacter koseri (strain ATCC BAA-895 / CDC 4225-83 / SGSC4696) TaxID=290338 RepID=A8AKE0_CITK8|nr:hypothetical protein CKO_02847 [Citrobacter koseri ATCC BAA-895]
MRFIHLLTNVNGVRCVIENHSIMSVCSSKRKNEKETTAGLTS